VEYGADASHMWDIAEIAANDYVQLLGSPNARRSYDYTDAAERLAAGQSYSLSPTMFNKRPQENTLMPLATQVNGLYAYLLGVGGYTAGAPTVEKVPEITSIVAEDSFLNPKYTIRWAEAESGDFEYTVVMYPVSFPFLIEAVRTVNSGEAMEAVFGTVTETGESGEMLAVLDYYAGDYMFVVYAKDANGFVFASEPVMYSFGTGYFDTLAHLEAQRAGNAENTIPDTETSEAQEAPEENAQHDNVMPVAEEAVALGNADATSERIATSNAEAIVDDTEVIRTIPAEAAPKPMPTESNEKQPVYTMPTRQTVNPMRQKQLGKQQARRPQTSATGLEQPLAFIKSTLPPPEPRRERLARQAVRLSSQIIHNGGNQNDIGLSYPYCRKGRC